MSLGTTAASTSRSSATFRKRKALRSGLRFILRVVFDRVAEKHDTGPGHPERKQRLEAFAGGLEAGGLSRAAFLTPAPASDASIEAVHPKSYVAMVQAVCEATPPGATSELPTGDTVVSHDSFAVALAAAGGALFAARSATVSEPALALVRPPGHHAEPARGMGFCIFNNIALAAAWALRERGNALIADFDYHHGNGTQTWVEQALDRGQRGLGFFSTHAYPAYPGTGAFHESHACEAGLVVDIPLPLSTATEDFIGVWAALLPSIARRMKPRTILVSAGFDFLAGDPIAGLPVAPRAVDALCGLLGDVAANSGASLAFVLEGGYSLDNLRASGATMALDFGPGASSVEVPNARPIKDERLRSMVDRTLNWLA